MSDASRPNRDTAVAMMQGLPAESELLTLVQVATAIFYVLLDMSDRAAEDCASAQDLIENLRSQIAEDGKLLEVQAAEISKLRAPTMRQL